MGHSKKTKSMDFCRTGKGVMKDYSVGKGKHDHPHDRINGKPGSGLEPDKVAKDYGKAKGSKVAKDETKKKVKSTTKSNPDGSYSVTKSDGKKSATSTYKKQKNSNVYVNENDQKRTFTAVNNETKDDPAMNINRASRKGS